MSPCLERVVELLAPRIGRRTASNAVILAARKLGVPPEDVSRAHLPEIARNASTILRVFLGTEAARQLETEIASLEVSE